MIVRWAIQSTTASAGPAVLADACRKRGSSFDLHAWQDHELPDVREAETLVYYGSCKFIANILTTRRMPEGVFGCAGDFDSRRYIEHYGDFMLNRDARILSIRELLDSGPPAGRFFLRDVGDSKTLAGQVWTSRQWEMFAARRCEQEPIDRPVNIGTLEICSVCGDCRMRLRDLR